jgi:hypothetical protein
MDEDEGDYLGINLTGRQPVVKQSAPRAGHNSRQLELDKIVAEAVRGLKVVEEGEGQTIAGWLIYGEALNRGRRMFLGDLEFGQWVSECQLDTADRHERLAAMWAAENTDLMYEIMEDNPRIKTVRGAHSKYKAIVAAENEEEETEDVTPEDTEEDTDDIVTEDTVDDPQGGEDTDENIPDKPEDKPEHKPKGNGINTTNPDKTSVLVDATMVASSLVGVVTNMLMFESTQGREVSHKELASAIFDEVRNQSVDQLTEDEIEDFIENKLKRTLNLIMSSLPVLNGFETNVVKLTKKVENY